MERKFKGKSVSGIVITIEDKTAGEYFIATARIRDPMGKIWQVQFWNELATSFLKEDLTARQVYVEGGLKDDNVISAKYFYTDTSVVVPKNTTEEDRQSYLEWLERNNLVRVKIERHTPLIIEAHKRDCLKVNGRWESKIEYCCRTLGDKDVAEFLRELGDDGKLRLGSFDARLYREKLSALIDMSASSNGDYVEFWNEQESEAVSTNS